MPRPRPTRKQVIQRLRDKSHKEGTCRVWEGKPNKKGYPVIFLYGKKWEVYKLAWIIEKGPVPKGFMLHHTCEIPMCIRPSHLELVTRSEHNTIHKSAGLFCQRGHIMDVYVDPRGRKECRLCKEERRALDSKGRKETHEESRH